MWFFCYPEVRAVSVPMMRELRSLDGKVPPYNVNLAGGICKAAAPDMSKKRKEMTQIIVK
jgi:hypothetical protein